MSQTDRENIVLGSLLLNPALIETTDEFTSSLFTSPRARQTFEIIVKMHEDERPKEIDQFLLAERLGFEGAASYVYSLTSGLQRLNPANFTKYVRLLSVHHIAKRMIQLSGSLGSDHLKGGEFDLEKVSELVQINSEYIRAANHDFNDLKSLAAVEPKEIIWLWPSRIPFGMLTLLAGNAGQGKSFISITLASMLSRGEPLPDSGGISLRCDSLILAAEDPIAQSIQPRAIANAADLSRIFFLEEIEFDLKATLTKIRLAVEGNRNIRFIIIDPLNVFLRRGTDYFRDSDVRRDLLMPLSQFAEQADVAVLGVVHLRKSEEGNALSRIAGSVAYGAVARSVLGVAPDQENEGRRLLASIKCNYARRPGTLAFRIQEDRKVVFDDQILDIDPEGIFLKPDAEGAHDNSFAVDWLREMLRDGPLDLTVIRPASGKAGIKERTLFRARKKLGIISKTTGFGQFKTTSWELPA